MTVNGNKQFMKVQKQVPTQKKTKMKKCATDGIALGRKKVYIAIAHFIINDWIRQKTNTSQAIYIIINIYYYKSLIL